MNTLILAAACLVTAGFVSRVTSIRRNARIAKATGFKVFATPVYMNETWWMLSYQYLLPLLNLLPEDLTKTWLRLSQRWTMWRNAYSPFEEAGSDTVILATPSENMLCTCDPVVIHQIMGQSKNVRQDYKVMKLFAIWGDNIITSDGEDWRQHRRVVNAGFTPATHAAVWDESVEQAQTLNHCWQKQRSVIPVLRYWMSKLTLNVVSSTFVHKKLTWENESVVPKGHKLAFEDALNTALKNLILISTFRNGLRWVPIKKCQEAYTAFTEWTLYLTELRQSILDRFDETAKKRNKSLLESIVVAGATGEGSDALPEDHAFGNIFLTLLAGHETTANTLTFIILLLAIFPEWQRKVQGQIDQQLGSGPRQQWSFGQDYQALQQGEIYAVVKETMRVYNVVPMIFRRTATPLTLQDSQGVTHQLPADILCQVNFGAVWRNPDRWQAAGMRAEGRSRLSSTPVMGFDPERWLKNVDLVNDEELHVPRFFPFGQGPRQCPGERFAMVEMTAVIATIYKNYSIELVVPEETLSACGGDQKAAWSKTRDHAMRVMTDDVVVNLNLELTKELPIEVVDRRR